jgi:hypothetical protein
MDEGKVEIFHEPLEPDGYSDAESPIISARVQGDTHDRFVLQADGAQLVGPGSEAPTDTGAVTVASSDIDSIEVLTQTAYDALASPDDRVLYVIVG